MTIMEGSGRMKPSEMKDILLLEFQMYVLLVCIISFS